MTPQTITPVSATNGTPTPVYTGPVTAAASVLIKNNLATITLNISAFPSIGYNAGQQVTLWGYTTLTYLNGKTITVSQNNPVLKTFSFPYTHADVNSTNDTGNTAPSPTQKFSCVHLEIDDQASTNAIFVGDGTVAAPGTSPVASGRYLTKLLLATNPSVWIGGEGAVGQNIDASRIFVDTNHTGTEVQVTLFT